MIASRLESIQVTTLLIALIGLAAMVTAYHWDVKHSGWYALPLSWLLHTIVYYAVLTYDRTFGLWFDMPYTDWSAWLRLHSVSAITITILIILYRLYTMRRRNDNK